MRLIQPMERETLEQIDSMCFDHNNCESMVTPKYFM